MASLDPRLLALLEGCKEHPEEDAPRLVLADWLQENGRDEAERARGEFIHLQCRLASLPRDDPAREGLEDRGRHLRERHEDDWLGPWRGVAWRWSWLRGFSSVTVGGVGWLRGPFLRPEAWGWLGQLTVENIRARSLPRLLRAQGMALVNGLALSRNPLRDAGVETLAAPHLARLRSLGLGDCRIGPAGVELLASSPGLANLTSLGLWGNRIGPDGARALAGSPHLTRLTRLGLALCGVGDEGVIALLSSPNRYAFRSLDLVGNRLTNRSAEALLASRLGRLESLGLGGNAIDPEHQDALKERFGRVVRFLR